MTDKERFQDVLTRLYDNQISNIYKDQEHIKDVRKRGLISEFEFVDLLQETWIKIQGIYDKIEGYRECLNVLGYTITGGLDSHVVVEL